MGRDSKRDFRKGPNLRREKTEPRTRMRVKVANIEMSKYHHPGDDPSEPDGGGEAVGLSLRLANMRVSQFWSLTALTTDELDAVKKVIDSAFETARPICIKRDEEAIHAYENGDDTDPRIYRAAPILVDREGGERPHSPLLQKRLAALSGGDGATGDSDGPVRGEGSAVAQPEPSDVGGQDHPAP